MLHGTKLTPLPFVATAVSEKNIRNALMLRIPHFLIAFRPIHRSYPDPSVFGLKAPPLVVHPTLIFLCYA